MTVYVDGLAVSKLQVEAGDYRDTSITIPTDAGRPSISEILLHFDSGGRDRFVFKLDRLRLR